MFSVHDINKALDNRNVLKVKQNGSFLFYFKNILFGKIHEILANKLIRDDVNDNSHFWLAVAAKFVLGSMEGDSRTKFLPFFSFGRQFLRATNILFNI